MTSLVVDFAWYKEGKITTKMVITDIWFTQAVSAKIPFYSQDHIFLCAFLSIFFKKNIVLWNEKMEKG